MQQTMSFKPNKYQEAIFERVSSGNGDLVVEATAGSGKTTTLVEITKCSSETNILFCAFNKHIAETLKEKVPPHVTTKTIHSLGLAIIRQHLKVRPEINGSKYRQICNEVAERICLTNPQIPLVKNKVSKDLETLCHFARVSLVDYKSYNLLERMVVEFSLDVERQILLFPQVALILEVGQQMATLDGSIDFDDMLWLPSSRCWNVPPSKRNQAKLILVDEAQDLSASQLEIVMKYRADGGRIVFVGDRNQAIYAFCGASSKSIDEIVEKTGAEVLPLSICYRCPTSHIELAQKLVPSIEPAEGAIEGEIKHVEEDKLIEEVRGKDLILCRTTAPLLKWCIRLIANRVRATVRGRDIGKQISKIVQQVSEMEGYNWDEFGKYLFLNYEERKSKLVQQPNWESLVESLKDKIEGVLVCYQELKATSAEHLCRLIENLFSDSQSSVVLSTGHRAKGLENKRVIILHPEKLPLRWPSQSASDLRQELNLKFVCLTRAKDTLIFVEHEEDDDDGESKANSLSDIFDEQQ